MKINKSFSWNTLYSWAGIALIALCTIFRAGNRFLPLTLLEWLALMVLLGVIFAHWDNRDSYSAFTRGHSPFISSVYIFILLSPLLIPALQLLPVDIKINRPQTNNSNAISLIPDETWLSLLAGIPIMACATLALGATQRQVKKLAFIWVAIAILQATLGLLQLGFPQLLFGHFSSSKVLGTFGNRNGLANFIIMAIPLLLMTLFDKLHRQRTQHSERDQRVVWLSAGGLLLLVTSLLATLSRAGIATGVIALILSTLLLSTSSTSRKQIRNTQSIFFITIVTLLTISLFMGEDHWLNRFDTDRLINDERMRTLNRESAWLAAKAYWPWGSGLGTFGAVFPYFSPSEMGFFFVNFAHNDYLELLVEAGALLLPSVLALLWLVSRRLVQLARSRRLGWSEADRLAIACGIAVFAQALHAWVDYPWQIPANAMLGAFMLGVFLREPKDHTRHSHDK